MSASPSLVAVALLGAALGAHAVDPCFNDTCIAPALKSQVVNRPQLLPYDPVAETAAVVITSDKMARFTVLTDHLIRMEEARVAGQFEDRASLAVLNRKLTVPKFSHAEADGVLTITTAAVKLTYTVGKGFTPATLSAEPTAEEAKDPLGFPGWKFGDANPGNLLGTVRGQDGQSATPLNCTLNRAVDDNGEYNHCEWGLVSRDGWVVYDDSANAYTDENDWWSTTGKVAPPPPPPPGHDAPRNCSIQMPGMDAVHATNCAKQPGTAKDEGDCCAKCVADKTCTAWVFATGDAGGFKKGGCWTLRSTGGTKKVGAAGGRTLGLVGDQSGTDKPDVGPGFPQQQGPQFSDVKLDTYGFFHGWKYMDALKEYQMIGGKAIMVPKYAMGIWWSRWYDLNNYDTKKVVADYESREIPLDVFVIDMDWHTKDNWSGFTFDPHLFPFPEDDMGYLNAKGLFVTLNLHDASGVNSWDAMFAKLTEFTGKGGAINKITDQTVPMNLVNATVTYAVEDIVLGDLINNKHVSFWWIDWQQGGAQGGMTGYKQNPTIWLAHLRCTDRHRVGDKTRGMVLARWGGMGHHRYQVGFSGDVAGLSWGNLAYQPYFSATAANVLFPSWSHDIEGDWTDQEMYTRWLQVGSFSGTMRSHERGMSAGGCGDQSGVTPSAWGPDTGKCSLIAPWDVGPKFVDANRRALQGRERLLPYIYNHHRHLFDAGVGIIQPMYYHHPKSENAYRMTATENAQYYFGSELMVGLITAPAGEAQGDPSQTLATKQVWVPPGSWYDMLTGKVVTVTDETTMFSRGYTLGEVPMWAKAGSVIPYLPLKSLRTLVGVATKQYEYLGFKLIPGHAMDKEGAPRNHSHVAVYEDDGNSTDYLDGTSHVHTHCNVTTEGQTTVITIVSVPGGAKPYAIFPKERSYQIRLPNGLPPSRVGVSMGASTAILDVPFVRFGSVENSRRAPKDAQWYYAFEEDEGLGPVIDIPDVPTTEIITITVTTPENTKTAAAMSDGLFGTLIRGIYAHANEDIDRSNPDSNSPGPAWTSRLSSVGTALESLADPARPKGGFAAAVAAVPGLLANATAELRSKPNGRTNYSLALLA